MPCPRLGETRQWLGTECSTLVFARQSARRPGATLPKLEVGLARRPILLAYRPLQRMRVDREAGPRRWYDRLHSARRPPGFGAAANRRVRDSLHVPASERQQGRDADDRR